MATGPYARNHAQGAWTLYHPSGNVAARGAFDRGYRHGAWQFFHDTPTPTPMARGSFSHGSVVGTWRHYDAAGKLLATSQPTRSTDHHEGTTLMTFQPDRGVQHEVHRIGGVDGRHLHGFYKGSERLFTRDDAMWDGNGHLLEKVDGVWVGHDCRWSKQRKRLARATDLTSLHLALHGKQQTCDGGSVTISAERGKRLDELVAARRALRAPSPAYVKELLVERSGMVEPDEDRPVVLVDVEGDEPEGYAAQQVWRAADLSRVIVDGMGWYIEWPHIDGRFMRLHATMAGYRYFANGETPADLEPPAAE
jgi:hypothetical protein